MRIDLERKNAGILCTKCKPVRARSQTRRNVVATGWRRLVFLALAGLFFLFGAAGAILPGLPATPFLLLTSYFLLRSSPALNERMLRSRVFGPILVDWQERGGVRLHIKIKAIALVVLMVGVTLFYTGMSSVRSTVVVLSASIGVAVIYHLPLAQPSKAL